jgi:hypothetical protein
MSLLNLNSPEGRSPRGKGSSRAWMGIGLIVAVLGIGSTFAANIQINDDDTSEFGQGVVQTVYCGGDASVTIAPISTYVNTVLAAPAEIFTARFARSYFTNLMAFTETDVEPSIVNGKRGWWLTNLDKTNLAPNQSLDAVEGNSGTYVFSEELRRDNFEYTGADAADLGYFKVRLFYSEQVVKTPAVEAIPASFKIGGVLISDIPSRCEGVNFVISSFAETGAAQTLISSGSDVVKEVAVHWTGGEDSNFVSALSSKDRTALAPTSLISTTQNSDSLKVLFETASGTALSASNLFKIIVETQEDAIS